MGGYVTKSWDLVDSLSGRHFIVQLRHHTGSGYRKVELNGQTLFESRKLLDDGQEFSVPVVDGKQATIKIEAAKTGFQYCCKWDDKIIPDVMTEKKEFVDFFGKIAIPKTETDAQQVTWYTVQIDCDSGEYHIRKRYRDFVCLDEQVRSAFGNDHLTANLPSLPPKRAKLIQSHTAQFIEDRRLALEKYLSALMRFPKANTLPDLLAFFKNHDKQPSDTSTSSASCSSPSTSAFASASTSALSEESK